MGWDPRRWRTFLIQCLNLFQAKPVTFQLNNAHVARVAFAASYLQAEDNLFNLWMRPNERFTTFIVCFEKEAYETGWNYNVLRYALQRALPQRIKNVLQLAPKQPTYEGYKALAMQVDQRYWEDRSEYSSTRTQWNAGGQAWQPRIPNNPANPQPPNPAPLATPGT
ncbi:hypothetical protein C0992_001232 [Termitomyces sp. T32_za158]|nr:hypothetical protein C0992_001232 [Termitomyces sp. T32_za158]